MGSGRIQGPVGKCRPIFSTKESSVLQDHFLLTKNNFYPGKLMNSPMGHIYREELYIPGVSNGFTFYAKYNGLVVVAAKVFYGRELVPRLINDVWHR